MPCWDSTRIRHRRVLSLNPTTWMVPAPIPSSASLATVVSSMIPDSHRENEQKFLLYCRVIIAFSLANLLGACPRQAKQAQGWCSCPCTALGAAGTASSCQAAPSAGEALAASRSSVQAREAGQLSGTALSTAWRWDVQSRTEKGLPSLSRHGGCKLGLLNMIYSKLPQSFVLLLQIACHQTVPGGQHLPHEITRNILLPTKAFVTYTQTWKPRQKWADPRPNSEAVPIQALLPPKHPRQKIT